MTIEWKGKPNRKYFLRHLIEQNNFTTMIEVGVRDGRTTFYLLDNIPNLTIYGIDLNVELFYNNTVKEKYGTRLVAIQGDSSQVAEKCPSVDLVFIDGNHSYEGCKKDIIAYASKVKPNGILSGHDYDFVGVNTAVNELVDAFDVGPNNVWLSRFTNQLN
jgi:predicted O-methyltransferase YrrM